MITAIDSNILIDVIGAPSQFTDGAIKALGAARATGALTICPIVAAEISGHFDSPEALAQALREMEIPFSEFKIEDLHHAGRAYNDYKRRSGNPKDRMLADFLIGAHALHQADALLTRDRGYYRTYFPELKLIDF